MKCLTPEISWHSREPIHALDFQPFHEDYRLISCGQEHDLRLWKLNVNFETSRRGLQVEFLSSLKRHQDPINVARFSPCGKYIASGDVRQNVMIWQQSEKTNAPDIFGDGDDEVPNKENWTVMKTLRGHCQEVWDLAWSPDCLRLVTVSRDPSVIVWDIEKGRSIEIIRVTAQVRRPQGVAFDPLQKYFAVIGLDRCFQIHRTDLPKFPCCFNVSKADVPVPFDNADVSVIKSRLFLDENTSTFFRRLEFTPDGNFLIVPAGCVEYKAFRKNVTYIFQRNCLNKPCLMLPLPDNHSIVVRCNPVLFNLLETEEESALDLPYRMVFAVATLTEVIVYDTQQAQPLAYVTNIHYQWITDLAWSNDGRILMVCSLDGYCSILAFDDGELGTRYIGPAILISDVAKPNASPTSAIKSVLDAVVGDSANHLKEPSTPQAVVPSKATPKVMTLDKFIGPGGRKKSDGVLSVVRCVMNKLKHDVEHETKRLNCESAASASKSVPSLVSNSSTSKRGNKTPKRVQLTTVVQGDSSVTLPALVANQKLKIPPVVCLSGSLTGSGLKQGDSSSSSSVSGSSSAGLKSNSPVSKTPKTIHTCSMNLKCNITPRSLPAPVILSSGISKSGTDDAVKLLPTPPQPAIVNNSPDASLSNTGATPTANGTTDSDNTPSGGGSTRSGKRRTPGIADYFRKMGSPQFQTKKRRIEGAEGLGDDSGVPSDPGTNQPPDTSDDCEIELVVVKDAKDSKTTLKQTPKSVGRKTPNRITSKKRPSGSIVSTKNTGAMNSKNSAGMSGAKGAQVQNVTGVPKVDKLDDLVSSVVANSIGGCNAADNSGARMSSTTLVPPAATAKPAGSVRARGGGTAKRVVIAEARKEPPAPGPTLNILAVTTSCLEDESSNECMIISPPVPIPRDKIGHSSSFVTTSQDKETPLNARKQRPLGANNNVTNTTINSSLCEFPAVAVDNRNMSSISKNSGCTGAAVERCPPNNIVKNGLGPNGTFTGNVTGSSLTPISSGTSSPAIVAPGDADAPLAVSLRGNVDKEVINGPQQQKPEKKKPKRAQLITL